MRGRPRATVCRLCGAPRFDEADQALCEAHWRETNARYQHDSNQRAPVGRAAEYQRVRGYLAEARAQGATEAQVWRVVMACCVEYARGETCPHWLRPFVAAELTYLRAHTDVIAKLDAWIPAPSRDGKRVRDTGWNVEETA